MRGESSQGLLQGELQALLAVPSPELRGLGRADIIEAVQLSAQANGFFIARFFFFLMLFLGVFTGCKLLPYSSELVPMLNRKHVSTSPSALRLGFRPPTS